MPHCPHCDQPIDSQALTCPHCRRALKAHGHPGIPLHTATGETYLCDSCTYHEDDTCTFPQRPYAKTCTLYQNSAEPMVVASYRPRTANIVKGWFSQNKGIVLFLIIIALSILMAIL